MNLSLNQIICNGLTKVLQRQFSYNAVIDDIYYDFEGHCLILYARVLHWSEKTHDEMKAIKFLYGNIYKYMKNNFGYPLHKGRPVTHYDKDEDIYRLMFVYDLTDEQEKALCAYCRILEKTC